MASGVASKGKGMEAPKPVYLTMLAPPSASGVPVFNLGSTAPRSSGDPVVFSIGGAAPRSSDGGVKGVKGKDDSTGKHAAAAAGPRPERDFPIPAKIFTTADVMDVFPESGTRDMLLAVAKDSGMTGLSSRGCWVSKEEEGVMQFKVDMPGLGKEHVKVRVEKDALVIKGDGDKGKVYRIELPSSQAFKMDQIKAELKDGVLVVTMPKIKGEERKDVYEIKVE